MQQEVLAGATTDFTRRGELQMQSAVGLPPAMLPSFLLLLPGHHCSRGLLGKLFVFFFLRVAVGQLEISHGELTVPNMLAKPASLYHRWEGNWNLRQRGELNVFRYSNTLEQRDNKKSTNYNGMNPR